MTDSTVSRQTSRTQLLRGGEVHSPADPFATAMIVEGDRIAWVGSESAADSFAEGVDEVIHLDGALVTPAFTDAHVHTTATGLALTGLDLSTTRTLPAALDQIRAYAAAQPRHAVLLGHGWDATAWPEQRPPSRAELDQAAGGRPLYLTRVDAHSALVTTALLNLVPDVTTRPGYVGDGPLIADAHHAVRDRAYASITPSQRRSAQRATLHRAAELGIGSLHECGGPTISSEEDLTALLALAAEEPGPRVTGYWAELITSAKEAQRIRSLGAHGAAGDLFVDGSLGSHTAHLHAPYLDHADSHHTGNSFLDAEAVAAHVSACTEAGLQAGFHAIGDAALTAVTQGARAAATATGLKRVRALRHRVEHAEMLDSAAIADFADLALTASVQPAFDAAWGGPRGMYEQRLGAARASTLNPYAQLQRAGVPLAMGSDSPVTPLDPWGTIRAAAFHHTPEHRISVRGAFTAHTRGGWRAIGQDNAGLLIPGAPADYALWKTGALIVQTPDARVSNWSTDPRSGTPGLPDLTPGTELPTCLLTVVGGREVYRRPNE